LAVILPVTYVADKMANTMQELQNQCLRIQLRVSCAGFSGFGRFSNSSTDGIGPDVAALACCVVLFVI
jgi:short-subunit dehydrogenase